MKIYSKSGIELLDIQVDDTSVRYRSIMKDDSLTLKFSHTETVNVPVGSYVNFEGQRYTLWLPENFKKHNTRNFEYTIVFGGWREALKLFKFKDLSSVPYRLKFSLTAKPVGFLQLLVDNMNVHDSGWTVGSYIDTSERTISFNHEYCADVLSRIAQEFNTEYDFEGKKIHLHKVEKFKSTPLALSYGRGNGFKSGVGRANDGDKQPIGRLYVQGGERNIDYSKYGSTTLLLPKSETLVLDGKTYRTDAEGMCVTRDGNDLIAEDSYDAKSIYPRREGTVSAVEEIDAEQHFYDIIDASIPEELDYADYRIEGDKATISFQSGALAGREFDIEQTDKALTGYIHEERRFKIVPQELDGVIMPGGAFVPAVGDKYAIFNISMPASYVSDASMEMFEECAKYFAENEKQKFTFTGELDGIWARKEWLEIGGKIVPGGHVLFSDEQFLPDGEVIRITSIKDYVNFPYKPEITLSNTIVPGGLGSDLGDLEAEEVVTEELHKKAIRYSKRRWRDTVETMSLLEKALLNFDKGINPIFVQTMQLLVGDESLQFRFVNNKTNPSQVEHNVFYNAETKVLTSPGGIIQHMTLGVDKVSSSHKTSEYKFWTMAGYNSPPLTPESSYYLYAKCSRANSTGSFLLSETSIAMDAEAGFHHLLVGVLNSEFENERSFVTLYGFTEILPGRITTDQIVSADGKTYFDLVNGIIGGRLRFLSNGTEVDISDWATQLEDNLSGLGDHVGDFEDYLEGAFKDGIISAAEAKAIKSYINTIESEKAAIEATYNKLFVNPLLTGTPKSNLLQAKVDFFGHVTTLIDLINDVILDGLVKPSEVTQVNNAFADYRDAYALFSQRIQEANDAIQSAWGSQLQGQIDGLDGHIGDFEDYIEGAFKDGVISAAEAKAIKSYINTIESEKAAIQATYNKLFVNPMLTGTPKSNLLQAKIDFFDNVTTLINLINHVILDGLVTSGEVAQVNNAFADYRDSYALFSQRIQEANESIQNKIAGDATEALARANIAKAITDKFGTTIDGALIQTVMMLLREADSTTVTAGISGLQGALKDNPAFWAGGEYAEAFKLIAYLSAMSKGTTPGTGSNQYDYAGEYLQLAKITMLHNGAAKIGDFIIEESGRIVMVDPVSGKLRLVFSTENLPSISDLTTGVSSTGDIDIPIGNTTTVQMLGSSANITQSNGTAEISEVKITINAEGRKMPSGLASFVTAELVLYRNNVRYMSLGTAGLFFTGDNYVLDYDTATYPARTINLGQAGTYKFKLEVSSEGDVISPQATSLAFNFEWNATLAGVKRQQYALDGMMFFYSDNHFYFTEFGGLDMRGKTNMPGILASGTIASNGSQASKWGAKVGGNASTITGGYRVYLTNMTHSNYFVQITPHTNSAFRISTKTPTYFEVQGSGAFDYAVFGNNY